MRTVLDVANTYEDWARRDDEMANSIIAQMSNYEEQETQAHYRYDASALREEAEHFREQAERLREQYRRTAQPDDPPLKH